MRPIPSTDAPAKTLLAAVFLLGALLSLLGSVLPVWGYHRLEAFADAGNHFLAMALGFLLGNASAAIAAGRNSRVFLGPVPGCLFAIVGVGLFAVLPPPYPMAWQLAGALSIGLALGSLAVMVFHHLGLVYRVNNSAAFQLSSLVALAGAIATPVGVGLVAIPAGSLALLALAVVPALLAWAGWRSGDPAPISVEQRSLRVALEDFRSPTTILLALLLFFQLGNELALLGWLPMFLIQHLGVSPAASVYALAAFVFAMLVGRTAAQAFRERARQNRVLIGGLGVAVLGCLMLLSTNNLFGTYLGLALTGLGFSPVFPVALERMAERFPYYHPGVLNALFAVGFVGGLLAPFSLGLFAGEFGIRVLMGLPIAGSVVVAVLLSLLWLESKVLNPAK